MSESDQILAAGVPVTLADGSTANVRFGMWGLKLVEDEFGSLGAMYEALNSAFDTGDGDAPMGPAFTTIFQIMKIALYDLDKSERELADLLDLRRLEEYVNAVGKALEQSLPEAEKADPKAPKAKASGTKKSRGATSTTSQQLSVVGQTKSSGG